MVSERRYQLKHHHKFRKGNRKYVADLESGDVFQLNDVEWEILSRYESQTRYQMVEALKVEYKLTAIFDGIERLERLGSQGSLLRLNVEATAPTPANREQPKLLVPFDFTREKTVLGYGASLNRYRSLTHLAEFAALETLAFSEEAEKKEIQDFDEVRVRNIGIAKSSALAPMWYAMDGYDGILLLSQFLTPDLLYYRLPDVPIVHCIEGAQQVQHVLLKTLLMLSAFQSSKDTLVVKASWMKDWLTELAVPVENVQVIPDGVEVTEPLGDKALAKQHTAALFEKPMFEKQPVVGLISGFEPNRGAAWIAEFARANPHLAIFVYDEMLEQHYRHPPENVVIFGADDDETRSVLPMFFQALDLVCFAAMPGTPLSVVLEAMTCGTPCVAMAKYGMPPEVAGAGIAVEAEWDNLGNFYVPMAMLSEKVNKWLQPSPARTRCEDFAREMAQRYTPRNAARALVQAFVPTHRRTDDFRRENALFPPIFCRQYEPETGTTRSSVYRLGTNRYDHLETALVEVLAERHTSAEVESVFKHFRRECPPPMRVGDGFPDNDTEINPAG